MTKNNYYIKYGQGLTPSNRNFLRSLGYFPLVVYIKNGKHIKRRGKSTTRRNHH